MAASMKRYYFDTCIWRDYFEDRKDKFRALGDLAFYLIKNTYEKLSYKSE